MLLRGKPVAKKLFEETKTYIQDQGLTGTYVLFLLLSENVPSKVYVGLKAKKAEQLGLKGRVFEKADATLEEVIQVIEHANADSKCIGIVVQLPLPSHLQEHQAAILLAVDAKKDLDGLGGVMFGRHSVGLGTFIPATPKAVIEVLKYYDLADVQGKTIMILGQSNLTGKPLAVELMNRGATVCAFNIDSDKTLIHHTACIADMVVSATGHIHLIDVNFFSGMSENELAKKTLIDVGRGYKHGKPAGDIDWECFQDTVNAVTPVPGGIGPVTVACLFHNLLEV